MTNRFINKVFIYSVLLLLFSCSDSRVSGDRSDIVAEVNGEVITEAQLEASLESLFGKQQVAGLDAAAKQKALEALVSGRAISQLAAEEIDQTALITIEYKTRAYRDKLLLGEYLKSHARPEPVSNEMVKDYYDNHLSEFGAATKKEFEMLITVDKPSQIQRKEIVEEFNNAIKSDNWKRLADTLRNRGFNIAYRTGNSSTEALDSKLLNVISLLDVKQISQVTWIAGKPMVVRVLSVEEQNARPLHSVSAEIRKKLLPLQLKQAIKQVSDKVLEDSEIEIVGKSNTETAE